MRKPYVAHHLNLEVQQAMLEQARRCSSPVNLDSTFAFLVSTSLVHSIAGLVYFDCSPILRKMILVEANDPNGLCQEFEPLKMWF